MTYNVPLSSLVASDGNVTYAQNTILRVGQGSNITVSSSLYEVNGNIGIGTTSPTSGFKLDTIGNLRVAGNIVATSEITAYFSDIRLKTNVTPITNAVNLVMAINGVYYNPNDIAVRLADENHESHKVGLLAQEVEKILPQIIRHAPFDIGDNGVSKSGENYKTIQYERMVPLLVEAIKELKLEIDRLKQSNNR